MNLSELITKLDAIRTDLHADFKAEHSDYDPASVNAEILMSLVACLWNLAGPRATDQWLDEVRKDLLEDGGEYNNPGDMVHISIAVREAMRTIEFSTTHFTCCEAPKDQEHMFGCPNSTENRDSSGRLDFASRPDNPDPEPNNYDLCPHCGASYLEDAGHDCDEGGLSEEEMIRAGISVKPDHITGLVDLLMEPVEYERKYSESCPTCGSHEIRSVEVGNLSPGLVCKELEQRFRCDKCGSGWVNRAMVSFYETEVATPVKGGE